MPVLLKLLVDLVRAITSLSREPINLLAGIGGKYLGVLADFGAFAGSVVLSSVLELGCVGWWRILISIGFLLEFDRASRTFEPLLSGLGVTTSLVEVVSGTNRSDGTADLESSGHVCWRWLLERMVCCC